jgi:hypothetical protein
LGGLFVVVLGEQLTRLGNQHRENQSASHDYNRPKPIAPTRVLVICTHDCASVTVCQNVSTYLLIATTALRYVDAFQFATERARDIPMSFVIWSIWCPAARQSRMPVRKTVARWSTTAARIAARLCLVRCLISVLPQRLPMRALIFFHRQSSFA